MSGNTTSPTELGVEVPEGQAPELRPGESWDPVMDRVTGRYGDSRRVRRPGMCTLCPRPGVTVRLGCVHEHVWTQQMCEAHLARSGKDGDVNCMACWGEDLHVVGIDPARSSDPQALVTLLRQPARRHWCDVHVIERVQA
jgi:hypothetical protein